MPFALFDDALSGYYLLFSEFIYQDQIEFHDLNTLDSLLDNGWTKKLHANILIDYEFQEHKDGKLKILWFKNKDILSEKSLNNFLNQHDNDKTSCILNPDKNITKEEYIKNINTLKKHILAGDNYQTNFTYFYKLMVLGNPINLYRRLRQKAAHQALIKLLENNWILSFSPELFFELHDNQIKTEPMKGTISINENPQKLRDEKNLAENTMIVDLMRNDLGKICKNNTIEVKNPFKIIKFHSVYQMITNIHGQLQDNIKFSNIIQALFPCGSITGAPKIKTIEIIDKTEKNLRNIYTGSIGYIEKNYAKFNVAIRTLSLEETNENTYQAYYGVGGGITIDSNPESEWQETELKAQLISNLSPDFDIFETMLVKKQHIELLDNHLTRLKKSAQELNFKNIYDWNKLKSSIFEYIQKNCAQDKIYRLKLTLTKDNYELNSQEIEAIDINQKIIIADLKLENRNYLRRYKTNIRHHFDLYIKKAIEYSAFDAIFFNKDGYLLEGARSFIAIRKNDKYFTPTLELDILPSITRELFINKFNAKEKYIDLEELLEADEIIIGNALRGLLKAEIADISL